jgi:DNA-directed RNA polymerase specialized sigma24 family protein
MRINAAADDTATDQDQPEDENGSGVHRSAPPATNGSNMNVERLHELLDELEDAYDRLPPDVREAFDREFDWTEARRRFLGPANWLATRGDSDA